jgi:hypothetical protein
MSSRRAKTARPDPDLVPSVLPLSARIAWSYLASLGAVVVAAGSVILGNSSLGTAACRAYTGDDAAGCRLGWAVVSGLVGLVLGWILLGTVLHLGWRYWLSASAFAAGLVSVDRLETWWWWLLAGVVPLAAALASHSMSDPRRNRGRDLGLAIVCLAAAGALVWWLAL